MSATKADHENIHRATGAAPDKPTHPDELEVIIDDGSSGATRRGLSVSGISATVIWLPDLHASDEDWHAWLDGFLRP